MLSVLPNTSHGRTSCLVLLPFLPYGFIGMGKEGKRGEILVIFCFFEVIYLSPRFFLRRCFSLESSDLELKKRIFFYCPFCCSADKIIIVFEGNEKNLGSGIGIGCCYLADILILVFHCNKKNFGSGIGIVCC